MKTSLKLGGAFIGLVVGVGFASGQEILQFFGSFGIMGLIGALLALALFAFLVMNLYQIGSRLQTQSHKEAMEYICGRHLGRVVDLMLTFFLFGTVVVMLAGASSSFEQQLGIGHSIGGVVLGVLTIITVCLGLKRVITLMSLITPVLMLIVAIIAVYALSHVEKPLAELEQIALAMPHPAPNWLLSAFLYVSYNIAATAAVLVVMGGSVANLRQAGLGGLLGGAGVGLLILVMALVMLVQIDVIAGSAIPTLLLSNNIAPWFGDVMLALLLVKLYCTTTGLTYALVARCAAYGLPFRLCTVAAVILAFVGSQFGFVKLVGMVYPAMGYLGFVLMLAIVVTWWRDRGAALGETQRG
ncbi:hypothetical protein [Pseudomonas citronellolis]|uniref:YkvI family membrane protein n=1 Tax=Pseudomonas citronellolis TaxID=53408 RepID=UPI0007188822|nr:hypothetical protein [Pseudomonas citronellolis]KRV81799.1 hypothetical protein AO742_00570 [Pseudomonas citronellolis]KRW77185.1 hypothetical protein AO738_09865 [Pseudomonas citronellolis]